MEETNQGFAVHAAESPPRWPLWVAVVAAVTGWATAGYLYLNTQPDNNLPAVALSCPARYKGGCHAS